jgi:ADP-ribose pyrophosphatase
MKKLVPADAKLIPDRAQQVFEGVIFDVYQWDQTLYDGSTAKFEMLRRPDTVEAICITGDNIIVLDDTQPHYGSKLTFPGGRVDPEDATIEDAARREIKEETGYEFNQFKLVRIIQPHFKIEWFVYLLVAWDVKGRGASQLDAGEKNTVGEYSFADVAGMAERGEGYIGGARDILAEAGSIQDLIDLPVAGGTTVDR